VKSPYKKAIISAMKRWLFNINLLIFALLLIPSISLAAVEMELKNNIMI
jgi:hypothetical protein